ncbi:MAG: Na+/H+ antiporter subunit E [Verrucomicrobia bacterium]|nr:Na+/H+ antiporter subunit E [Verrucomicrobiota bacterium]MCH8511136.1 Na+/H+ antiporter subunit E [Kiritimatiellia bacterium]
MQPPHESRTDIPAPPTRLIRVAGTFALALILWQICTGHDPAGWILGLPAACIFTYIVVKNNEEAHHLHFRALPAFLLYFLTQSFRSGLDVAHRALHPEREINPGFCTYPARLPEGTPQAVFANMISLLPGTLSWSLVDGVHKVHLLSGHPLVLEELAQLESRVGKLFGIELSEELF